MKNGLLFATAVVRQAPEIQLTMSAATVKDRRLLFLLSLACFPVILPDRPLPLCPLTELNIAYRPRFSMESLKAAGVCARATFEYIKPISNRRSKVVHEPRIIANILRLVMNKDFQAPVDDSPLELNRDNVNNWLSGKLVSISLFVAFS
jgi:hypothetical protein